MIMLGMALADIEWKKLFTGKRVYGMVLARMVLLPLVAVFFLRTWGTMSSVPDSRSILLVTLLAAITPTAATIHADGTALRSGCSICQCDQCDDYRGMRSNDAVDGYVIYDVRKEAEWTKQ